MAGELEALRKLSGRQLLARLRDGAPIEPEALAGFEYRGVALLPRLARALSWTKFKKAFIADEVGLRGWNIRVVDSPLDDDRWEPRRDSAGVPKTFGHFAIRHGGHHRIPSVPFDTTVLDYAAYARGWQPMRWVRDPLVCLESGDPTRLLGGTYLDLGLLRLWTPAFFYLQREGPPAYVPPAHV